MMVCTMRQAINDLHEDEDFQKDASEARMPDVVNDVRLNVAALKKYEDDNTVMHVLTKLRRFQVAVLTRYDKKCWYMNNETQVFCAVFAHDCA